MGISVLELTLLVWLGAVAAGAVGALTGPGGRIIIVPMGLSDEHSSTRTHAGGPLAVDSLANVLAVQLIRQTARVTRAPETTS
jgi:hypothetical protein